MYKFLIGLSFTLLLSPAYSEDTSKVVGATPGLSVVPEVSSAVYVINIPDFDGQPIAIYKPAQDAVPSVLQLFMLPYFKLDWEKMAHDYKKNCNAQTIKPSFKVKAIAEFFGGDIQTKVSQAVRSKYNIPADKDIALFAYKTSIIRVILGGISDDDSVYERRLWTGPLKESDFINGLAPRVEFPPYKQIIPFETDCEELKEVIENRDMQAEAYTATDVIERSGFDVVYSDFASWFMKNYIDRNESQGGELLITNRGGVKGSGFNFLGLFGKSKARSSSEARTKDTRYRTMSGSIMQDAVQKFTSTIQINKYCEGAGSCDSLKIEDALLKWILNKSTTTQAMIDRTSGYMLRSVESNQSRALNQQQVKQTFESSMSPKYAFSGSANIDCKAIASAVAGVPPMPSPPSPSAIRAPAAAEPAVGDIVEVAGSESNKPKKNKVDSNVPVGQKIVNGDKGSCSFANNSTLTDQNSINWTYDGKEWIPTSVNLRVISTLDFQSSNNASFRQTILKDKKAIKISLSHIGLKLGESFELNESANEVDRRSYVLEVTSDMEGTSVPLDEMAFASLCEDRDGCLITVGMKSWDDNAPERIATIGPYELLYSSNTKEWRRSEFHNPGVSGVVAPRQGKDGNSITEHAIVAWNKCYLTDGTYKNYTSKDDDSSGFSLLLWRNATYKNPNTICRVTIRD